MLLDLGLELDARGRALRRELRVRLRELRAQVVPSPATQMYLKAGEKVSHTLVF